MSKALLLLAVGLFAADAHADRLACTTGITVWKGADKPNPTICGAVSADNLRDNGAKVRRTPRNCKDFVVEFLSIGERDDPTLRSLCGRSMPRCYVVRIRDDAQRQGLGQLSSYLVFPNVQSIPTQFGLGASGLGHGTKSLKPTMAKRVHLELRCRKSP